MQIEFYKIKGNYIMLKNFENNKLVTIFYLLDYLL
jgi:hypothetical protein